MLGSRLEDAEVFEIGEEGKTDLRFHVSDLQFPHHQSQMLHRACPRCAAVADESRRLVDPLVVEEINGILERARRPVVVFGRHEDVGVEGGDLRRPLLGVLMGVLAHHRRHRLIEEWQVEVFDVHKFKIGVAPLLRNVVNPFGHGLALAAGPRASEDDGNPYHAYLPCCVRSKLSRDRSPAKRCIVRWRLPHATTPVTTKRIIAPNGLPPTMKTCVTTAPVITPASISALNPLVRGITSSTAPATSSAPVR